MIGDNIKKIRKSLGMSQVDLAKRLGISKYLLNKYESGVIVNIPLDVIERIAMALQVSPVSLVGWKSAISESSHAQNVIDMQVLDNLIATQVLLVDVFDDNMDTSRDILLLQALKEYRELRRGMGDEK